MGRATGTGTPHLVFVLQHPYPSARAVRIVKMVGSAVAAGYRATILTPAPQDRNPSQVNGPINVVAVRDRHGRGIHPSPFSGRWYRDIRDTLAHQSIACLVVSDLRLSFPGIRAARSSGTPVILDLGENFAAATKIWARHDPPLKRFLRSGPHVGMLERWAVRHADTVQVVVEERRQSMVDRGWRHRRHISVVSNYPAVRVGHTKQRVPIARTPKADQHEPLRMVYVGLVTEDRGLDTAVSAVREFNRRAPQSRAILTIVGDGPHLNALKEHAAPAIQEGVCRLLGWLHQDQADEYIRAAHIGIIPHWVNAFTNTTVPNKLFDYMSFGLPILASPMVPVKRIVQDAGCGLIYDGSVQSLVDSLRTLTDHRLREAMGSRGRAAVAESYNWGVAGKVFLNNVRSLTQ